MTGIIHQTKKFLSSITKPELYIIIVVAFFGLSTVFLLPVEGGYDEETHLVRVWEMSSLTFIPNEKLGYETPFPAVYREMSYRRSFFVRAVDPDFWKTYKNLALDAHDYIYSNVETRSVYSPPLLFPQAMVMRYLGQKLQLPALTVFYAIRLIGLLCYLALAWYSVRIIPFGKWLLAILASSPVVLLQASTISADTISNGIAFLFIAGTLAIIEKNELGWKEWFSLVFLFVILFWAKLNVIPLILLPFLIIKPFKFKISHGYVTLLVMAGILFLIETVGWNLLAYSRLSTAVERANPLEQLAFIFSHPLQFSSIIATDLLINTYNRLLNWIAIYGYAYWPVPSWTYPLYILAIFTALFLKDKKVEFPSRLPGMLGFMFIITYLATIISLYITFTPVGSGQVDGVQGRYFVTVMPLLFLALACIPSIKRIQLPSFLPLTFAATSLILYIAGMYLSYHVPCGSQYYQGGLCYQPIYKNWAPDEAYSSPISSQFTLSQEIVPECNGMTELRVWVNAAKANPNGITQFTLTDVINKQDVVDVSVSNSELSFGGWYSLHFQPDWSSNGKFYLLTIQGDDTGPQIAYSLRPEYLAGKLFENDQAIGQDMIFQTGCIAGWEKSQ